MFVEIVTSARAEFEAVAYEAGLFSNPPPGLLSATAWEAEEPDQVTVLCVWESPEKRGDFAFQHIMPLAQTGAVVSSPKRLKPVEVFARDRSPDA